MVQLLKHRFTAGTVEYIFRRIVNAAAAEDFLDTSAIFIDGTHVKASANIKKKARKAVPVEAKRYAKELREEINRDREEHGKKPFDDDSTPPKEKERTVSTTDPDAGVFHKGERRQCFAYEAHTARDRHNFILDVEVTAGNAHDGAAFDPLYDQLCQQYPEHKTVATDSAYKTTWICKRVFESGRVLSAAYKRPMIKKGGRERWKYIYDEYFDCAIRPEYKTPRYATTNRNGYREYRSEPYICARRPTRKRCLANTKYEKTATGHIWVDFIERAEDARRTPQYRYLYQLRREKIERIFADAKEKHGARYTLYRGMAQVSNWVKLKFAAMNLKKPAV